MCNGTGCVYSTQASRYGQTSPQKCPHSEDILDVRYLAQGHLRECSEDVLEPPLNIRTCSMFCPHQGSRSRVRVERADCSPVPREPGF